MINRFLINFFIWFLKYAPRYFKAKSFALLVMLSIAHATYQMETGMLRYEIGRLRALLKKHGIEPDVQGGTPVQPNWKKP